MKWVSSDLIGVSSISDLDGVMYFDYSMFAEWMISFFFYLMVLNFEAVSTFIFAINFIIKILIIAIK